MKKFIKLISLIVAVCLLTISFACTKEEVKDVLIYENIEMTDHFIVENGESDYVVVYPRGESTHIQFAVSELCLFFEQATGIKLTAVEENEEIYWSNNKKYISLGNTDLLIASGVSKNVNQEDLRITGYYIKTYNKSVFIVGGRENGVINGVYRFLKDELNFECFGPDEIVLNENVSNLKLVNFDDKVIPNIPFHATAQNELMLNATYARRLGMVPQEDFLIEMGGTYYHNWLGTVPKEENAASHPNWYSPDGGQLCLTRDMDGLTTYVKNKVIEVLQSNPSGYALGFTQEDDAGWCSCDSCKNCAAKYGANSASQILFMNMLWDKLEPWLKVNMPNREFYLYMFAYQNNTDPPKTDSNGNLPEEMILDDHIFVQYAPIYANGFHSYDYKNSSGSDNSSFDDMFKGWSKVTNNFMIWSYSFYYQGDGNLMPYFDFYGVEDTFKYLANSGAIYLFDEDHSGNSKTYSDWSRLKYYLRSKLTWDYDADLNSLTDKFFANYYKVANDTMRQIFDEYSSHYTYLIDKYNLTGRGNNYQEVKKEEYWPKAMLDRWMRLFDKALSDIEYLKETDYDTWKVLESRIRLDSISLRALSLVLYSDCAYVGNGNTIKQDMEEFGITLPFSKAE